MAVYNNHIRIFSQTLETYRIITYELYSFFQMFQNFTNMYLKLNIILGGTLVRVKRTCHSFILIY